jgi:hypothetical protein
MGLLILIQDHAVGTKGAEFAKAQLGPFDQPPLQRHRAVDGLREVELTASVLSSENADAAPDDNSGQATSVVVPAPTSAPS